MKKAYLFTASWCGPCKIMKPIISEVSKDYSEIEFKEVSVEEEVELTERYRVTSVPTLLMLNGDSEQDRITGSVSKDRIEKSFEDLKNS